MRTKQKTQETYRKNEKPTGSIIFEMAGKQIMKNKVSK